MKITSLHLAPLLTVALLLGCIGCRQPSAQSSNRWLLTPADFALLEKQHARLYPKSHRDQPDGRNFTEVDADDYLDDQGMRLLIEKMPNLQTISLLSCTRVTDKGLQQIAAVPLLKSLTLHQTTITDRALRHILNLTNLEYLGLESTTVTATGLATLAKLPKLTYVEVEGIPLTDEDKAIVKRALGKAVYFR